MEDHVSGNRGLRFGIRADNGRFPVYAKAMIKAEADGTVLTEEFGTGWPDTPHRVVRLSLDAAKTFQRDAVGERYLRSANGWSPIHKLQTRQIRRLTRQIHYFFRDYGEILRNR